MRILWTYWLALAAGLALTILAASLLLPADSLLSLPYYWNRFIAAPAPTPLAAYDGFYAALASGRTKKALRYLSPEMRRAFRQEIAADPAGVQRQTGDKAVLREVSQGECGPHEPACRRTAVYEYEYVVREGYTERLGGKEFYVAPGQQRLEMCFIQLPDGTWQISEL